MCCLWWRSELLTRSSGVFGVGRMQAGGEEHRRSFDNLGAVYIFHGMLAPHHLCRAYTSHVRIQHVASSRQQVLMASFQVQTKEVENNSSRGNYSDTSKEVSNGGAMTANHGGREMELIEYMIGVRQDCMKINLDLIHEGSHYTSILIKSTNFSISGDNGTFPTGYGACNTCTRHYQRAPLDKHGSFRYSGG